MHKAWRVVLEGLDWRFGALLLGHERLEVRNAVAAQTAVQARAGDLAVDELTGDHQQIIERQQQCLAPLHDYGFLGRGEGGLQAVRRVGAVSNPVTALPAADGILTHPQLIGQLRDGLIGRLNVMAGLRGCGRIRVQADIHWAFSGIDRATSNSITSLVRNNDPILLPM